MNKGKSGRKKIFQLPEKGGLPVVALLGRPNVGKSTLFNRLIRSNRAITHDRPGVTRDRMEGLVRRQGRDRFIIIDTGGVTLDAHAVATEGPKGQRGFEEEILRQAALAVAEADLLVMVVDGRDGLAPLDAYLADYLRRSGKTILLAVNKVDGPEKADLFMADFHVLGFEIIPCSAEHGFNVNALLDEIQDRLPGLPEEPEEDAETPPEGEDEDAPEQDDAAEGEGGALRLALLGRPNVGKSSLVNAMLGSERMIVSDIAGTTRDSVDVAVDVDGERVIFVDSAGVRRRSKITDSVERFSVNSSLKTSSKAQITLLVLDGQEGLTIQDKRLLELLDERKIPFILLVNKTDLITPKQLKDVESVYRQALAYSPHVPILMVSALNRRNLKKILPLAKSILAEGKVRVGTGQLNRMLESMLAQRQPPLVKRRRAKLYYMTQAESQPPTFVFFVSDLERVPESYARYLERSLRKLLGLKHTPIRVHFRQAK